MKWEKYPSGTRKGLCEEAGLLKSIVQDICLSVYLSAEAGKLFAFVGLTLFDLFGLIYLGKILLNLLHCEMVGCLERTD